MCKILKPIDWDLKSLIFIIMALQTIYLTKFLYAFSGVNLSLITGVIGFLSITFIPGVLILRVLHVHNLSSIESVLYTTGLSITFIMLMGLFMNIFYPNIGIEKPFSSISMYCTLILFIFILCLLAYIYDKDFNSSENVFDYELLFHPFTLLFLLMPFVSIIGTYLMNFYSFNIIQLLILLLIGLLSFFFYRVPSELYPFAIFSVSISLLLHKSLISNYVHGWDIQLAYRFSEATILSRYWDYSLSNPYNSLLAFPVLSTMYSNLCDINIHWVYKTIYSFLFSLAPLGLFYYYKSVIDSFDDKKALLSTLVFIFYYQFNSDIVDKQKIAELFFIFLLMLIITKKINPPIKSLLAILFSFALIQSHYGLSFILIFGFIFSYLLLFTILKGTTQRNYLITSTHIILFIVMSFSWYSYISSGYVFGSLIGTIKYTFNAVLGVLNHQMEPRTGMSIISDLSNIIYGLNTLLFLLLSFWILLGILQNTYNLLKELHLPNKKYEEYAFLPVFFLLLLVVSFFVSGNLGVDRIYQISLVMLSPFSLLGFQICFDRIRQLSGFFRKSKSYNSLFPLRIFSFFLIILFLFNSGFMYYANNMHISANFAIDKYSEYAAYTDSEMSGASWLKSHSPHLSDDKIPESELTNATKGIFSDYFSQPLFYEFYNVTTIYDAVKERGPDEGYYFKRTNIINMPYNKEIFDKRIADKLSQSEIYTNKVDEIYKFEL